MNDLSLKAQLDERRNSFNSNAPENVKKDYEAGVKIVAESGILLKAKQVGDIAVDFTLRMPLEKRLV